MREPRTAEELRATLFTSIMNDDNETLTRLCNDYTSTVIDNFDDWTRVPEAVRQDSTAVEAWVRSLMTLATIFADGGLPQLMEKLTGGTNNPIIRWQNALSHASQLARSGEYQASNQALLQIADE
jgi:hypothetical protein